MRRLFRWTFNGAAVSALIVPAMIALYCRSYRTGDFVRWQDLRPAKAPVLLLLEGDACRGSIRLNFESWDRGPVGDVGVPDEDQPETRRFEHRTFPAVADKEPSVNFFAGQFNDWRHGIVGFAINARLPIWLLCAVLSLLPLLRIALYAGPRARRRRRVAAGCCPDCGYDLRATTGRCPECGSTPETPEKTGGRRGIIAPMR